MTVAEKISRDFFTFVRERYDLETNAVDISKKFTLRSLGSILSAIDVILIGETHFDAKHQKWNGKLINALWSPGMALLIEHEPQGDEGQLSYVKPEIAKKAQQWDSTESHTSALFDQIEELSERDLIDLKSFEPMTYAAKFSKKKWLDQSDALMRRFTLSDSLLKSCDETFKRQTVLLESVPKQKQNLIAMQTYLKLWVLVADALLESFLMALSDDMVARNQMMIANIKAALKTHSQVLVVGGSGHFVERLSFGSRKKVVNPLFCYLKELPYLFFNPIEADPVATAPHLADVDIDEIEKQALQLAAQYRANPQPHFKQTIEELKTLCTGMVAKVHIPTNDQVQAMAYHNQATCTRVHDLAKTLQMWTVIIELSILM